MTTMELINILDSGMVEELRVYFHGQYIIVHPRNSPEILPEYQIARLWNSENGKGISILLADNARRQKE